MVTEFQVAGTVPEQTLETFAKAYLQAPSSRGAISQMKFWGKEFQLMGSDLGAKSQMTQGLSLHLAL